MKPFFKAVGHSLRYRWTILGAFLCSLLIAVIWSASITTVFPIVKIVLEGETAITWIEHEIENGEQNLLSVKNEVLALENEFEETQDSRIANKLDLKQDRIAAEEKSLQWYRDVQPYVQKYCLLYTSPSPRDQRGSRMPSSA